MSSVHAATDRVGVIFKFHGATDMMNKIWDSLVFQKRNHHVFCLCHVKDDRKKVRIKCGGNSYQTEPEVTSLSVPCLEDIEGGRP